MYIILYIIVHKEDAPMARANYELPEDVLQNVRALSGASSKRAAIIIALNEYIRKKKIEKLIRAEGKFPLDWTRASLKRYRG